MPSLATVIIVFVRVNGNAMSSIFSIEQVRLCCEFSSNRYAEGRHTSTGHVNSGADIDASGGSINVMISGDGDTFNHVGESFKEIDA